MVHMQGGVVVRLAPDFAEEIGHETTLPIVEKGLVMLVVHCKRD